MWVDVRPAGELIPDLQSGMLLHGGPPLPWEQMPGCTRGAIAAVMMYEGWAESPAHAEQLVTRGEIRLISGHAHGCVAPVAGIVGPSMTLMVVRDNSSGCTAYSPLNEGRGRVVRYGAFDAPAIRRLRWLDQQLAPLLKRAVHTAGGIDLSVPMVEAVHMGDELHNRAKAFTRVLLAKLATELHRCGESGADVAAALDFIAETDIFFLNLSMAACKATLRSIEGIEWCSLVSAMSQNGYEFGIQVSAFPGSWFTTAAPAVEGRYFEPWTAADACPAIGDSVITETAGLGAFAIGAAPALTRYIGGTPDGALKLNASLYDLVWGENPRFTIPQLNFRGAPIGIDVYKVVQLGRTPVTNAGIAHREAGIGQIGAGYLQTPLAVFASAWAAIESAWAAGAAQASP